MTPGGLDGPGNAADLDKPHAKGEGRPLSPHPNDNRTLISHRARRSRAEEPALRGESHALREGLSDARVGRWHVRVSARCRAVIDLFFRNLANSFFPPPVRTRWATGPARAIRLEVGVTSC